MQKQLEVKSENKKILHNLSAVNSEQSLKGASSFKFHGKVWNYWVEIWNLKFNLLLFTWRPNKDNSKAHY